MKKDNSELLMESPDVQIAFATVGKIKILHLEDLPSDAELVERTLRKGNIEFVKLLVDNKTDYKKALEEFSPDIILSDHTLPDFDSTLALKILKEARLNIPFILVTGTVSEEFAVEVMKQGACDYILKDHLERLPNAVLNAIEKRRVELQRQKAEHKLHSSEVQYRRLFEAAQDGILILNADTGVIEDVNPFLVQKLNYSHDEFVGKHLWEIGLFKDIAANKAAFLKLKKEGYTRYENLPLKTKDGQSLWVEFVSNSYDVDGRQVIQCNIRNITQRKLAEEQIIKEKNLSNSIISSLPELFYLFNTTGKFLRWNKNFETISGYNAEEISKMTPDLFFEGTEKKLVVNRIQETITEGRSNVEAHLVTRNKERIPVFLTGLLVTYEGESCIIGTGIDISERKKTEELLRESETNLRAIFDNTATGFLLLDADFDIISFNNRCNELAKVTFGKELQKHANFLETLPIQRRNIYINIHNKSLKGDEIHYEVPYPQKNGTVIWLENNIKPITDDRKTAAGVSVSITDITKRKKAEENLRQSEVSLKEAQSLSHIANWELDLLTNINKWSDELYNIFEVKRDDIQPSLETFFSFIHTEDLFYVREKIGKAFETFEESSFYVRMKSKNDITKYLYIEWKFEFDKNKIPTRLYGILQDITERKNADDIREKITADLLQRNKDLEQFSYIVSHNLRAPVANILGLSAIAQEKNLDPDVKKEVIEGLSHSAKQLDNVIMDLNTILNVKNEANHNKEMVFFSQLANDIHLSIENLIEKEKVILIWNFSEVDEMVTIKSYLHSIFYNLISNCIKYHQPNIPPVIEIKSRKTKNKIELLFKDNGMGIDMKKNGDKIFGLYKRFHIGSAEGKGMGLYMVKTQVESIGGKVSIESTVNKGTTFKIEFEN